ncbi:hypothetical protein CLF_100299 [Clonorchis sinensis]|uniref:Uncharacterized protein n=1 Tax=Clonorchis sinensis TaxID=79923 RepID=G7Y351_CLOSI|nr:hypothetical protein CLF_100299 [Clonorchis sinensis]
MSERSILQLPSYCLVMECLLLLQHTLKYRVICSVFLRSEPTQDSDIRRTQYAVHIVFSLYGRASRNCRKNCQHNRQDAFRGVKGPTSQPLSVIQIREENIFQVRPMGTQCTSDCRNTKRCSHRCNGNSILFDDCQVTCHKQGSSQYGTRQNGWAECTNSLPCRSTAAMHMFREAYSQKEAVGLHVWTEAKNRMIAGKRSSVPWRIVTIQKAECDGGGGGGFGASTTTGRRMWKQKRIDDQKRYRVAEHPYSDVDTKGKYNRLTTFVTKIELQPIARIGHYRTLVMLRRQDICEQPKLVEKKEFTEKSRNLRVIFGSPRSPRAVHHYWSLVKCALTTLSNKNETIIQCLSDKTKSQLKITKSPQNTTTTVNVARRKSYKGPY